MASHKKRIRNYKIYAVDFDGTLCESDYPFIKSPNTELIEFLKDRQSHGDKIILWTCRVGRQLDYALEWCKEQGIKFDAINDNLRSEIDYYGSNPRKVNADFYIDDRNYNCDKFKLPFTKG